MSADDELNLARCQPLKHGFRFGRRHEARKHLSANRETAETLGESVKMLLGEQSGGHQHRHLLASLNGLESGTHGYFGFAEPYIAAHQPIHRRTAFHVGFDMLRRISLVGSFLI